MEMMFAEVNADGLKVATATAGMVQAWIREF